MRAIDAAAVEAIFALRNDSRIDDDETQKRIEALLATAVEAEPVGEGDGLTVEQLILSRDGVDYEIEKNANGEPNWSVSRENDHHSGWLFLRTDGTWSDHASAHILFPSFPAARASLAAALKAGAL